ncbi:zinc finger protein 2-like isoform X1 [Aplysia californica]|uniref:Zinc finger protein 2-like isoform X1 n=1 Tax=Aplysia californica TaxID=6500 RepID=A0ABM0K8P3_APLCA|nr:zinc finger protein 2-like isoform X1 [Aplysia californica]
MFCLVVKDEPMSSSGTRSRSRSSIDTLCLSTLKEDVKHDIIGREGESLGVDEEHHLSVKEEPRFEWPCDVKAETNDKLNVESESTLTLRHSVVKDDPICTEEEDVTTVVKPECLTDICTVKTEPLFGHFLDFGDEVKPKVENFVKEEVSEWEGPDIGEVGKTEVQVGDVEDTCAEPVFVEDHMSQTGGLLLQISNVRSLCMEQSDSPDIDVVASSSPTSTFSPDPVTSSGSVVRASWDHGKRLNGKSHMSCDSKQSMGQGPDFNHSCALSFASCINSTESSSTTPPKLYKEMGAGCQDVPRFLLRESRYSGEKPHKCNVCLEMLTELGNLQKHKRTHTRDRPYKCEVCGATFTQSKHLQRHKRTHTREKPFTCEVCGATFTRGRNLQTHKRTHTGEKHYMCEVCGATFTQGSTLRRHKRIHTGEKPYKCEVCGVTFTQGSSLQRHKRIHTREKPYKCEVCCATFTYRCNLESHKRIHTGEKPYKCEVCGATFTQGSSLQSHKRTHTREKPYKCEVCGATFTQGSSLQRHMRVHTGEKPFKCEVCGSTFIQNSQLQSHKRIHTIEKPDKYV